VNLESFETNLESYNKVLESYEKVLNSFERVLEHYDRALETYDRNLESFEKLLESFEEVLESYETLLFWRNAGKWRVFKVFFSIILQNHPLSLRDISRQRETSGRFCCLAVVLQAKGCARGTEGATAGSGAERSGARSEAKPGGDRPLPDTE
jgi:hypothetical protein